MLVKRYDNEFTGRLYSIEIEFAGLVYTASPNSYRESWFEAMITQLCDFYCRIDNPSNKNITAQQPLYFRVYGLKKGEYMSGSIPLLDVRFDSVADIENFINLY